MTERGKKLLFTEFSAKWFFKTSHCIHPIVKFSYLFQIENADLNAQSIVKEFDEIRVFEMRNSCSSALISSSASFYRTYVDFYLCLTICITGSVFNTINVIVFTRKNMVSPTNFVLTWKAVADLAYLLSNIPTMMKFSVYTKNVCELTRLISVWMTLVLAVWRYLALVHPWKARNWCDMKITHRTVVAVYVLCSLIVFLNIIVKKTSPQLQTAYKRFIYIWYICLIPAIALPILTLG